MSSSVCAVLFDFGQVLSQPADPMQWQRMKVFSGLSEDALHAGYWKYRHAYDRGDLGAIAYWQQIAEDNGLHFDDETLSGLIEADVELWARLNQPMLEWAQSLQRAGIKTGILSNIGDAMAEGLCKKFDWLGAFHHRVWSHALNLAKPESAIYLAAAEGLGCTPATILFLDDKQENIDAARTIGMKAILYHCDRHDRFALDMEQAGLGELLQLNTAAS